MAKLITISMGTIHWSIGKPLGSKIGFQLISIFHNCYSEKGYLLINLWGMGLWVILTWLEEHIYMSLTLMDS